MHRNNEDGLDLDPNPYYICNAYEPDFDAIKQLLKENTTEFFGPPRRKFYDAPSLFKTFCSHRILIKQKKSDLNIIGYGEFRNFPNLGAVPRDGWLDWLNVHYCCALPLTVTNTHFCLQFIYNNTHNPRLLLNTLRELFYREQKVHYICVVEMPERNYMHKEDQQEFHSLLYFSEVFYPRCYNVATCNNVMKFHVINRDNVIHKMRYRKALPEDNDDIVQIVDYDRPELRETLGDYYIAEELLREDTTHSLMIVTEIGHITGGFFWLNDNVDIMSLAQNYEMDMYGNLIKFDANKPCRKKILNVTAMQKKPISGYFTSMAIRDLFEDLDEEYCIRNELSCYTLNSQYHLRVISNSGTITTSNEDFFLREGLFAKFQKIDEYLRHTRYYIKRMERELHFFYNVSENCSRESLAEPPDKRSNVFALQLFGLHPVCDERMLFRFLAAAFSAYPERDYCIFSIPPQSKITKSVFELLKYFNIAIPRPGCVYNDRLYITHRSCIFGELVLRPLRSEDVEPIEFMLSPQDNDLFYLLSHDLPDSVVSSRRASAFLNTSEEREAGIVRQIMHEVLENPLSDYTFLTIRFGNIAKEGDTRAIVGYIILRKFTQLHMLEKNFKLPPFNVLMAFQRAEVVILRLQQFYHYESDNIFRELGRLTGYLEFIYFKPIKNVIRPLTNDLAQCMQPMEPRRIKNIHNLNEDDFVTQIPYTHCLPEEINLSADNFAIYQHNLRPSLFFGNKQTIVVIGFSYVSKAFLRSMLFCWNSYEPKNQRQYTCLPNLNIIVIAQPGVVEAEYDSEFSCPFCKTQGDCWINYQNFSSFVRDTVKRMDLRTYIRFINGTVRRIEREDKCIVLQNNCEIFYDDLLLLCDTEFGLPKPLQSKRDVPPNYTHINNRLDKIIFFHKLNFLKANVVEPNLPRIVIYGAHVRTFECINFMLTHDIPAKWITLIMPFTQLDLDVQLRLNNPYADANIESILVEMVEDLGVKVCDRLNFCHWVRYRGEENISCLTFDTYLGNKEVTFECDLFISFCETNVDVTIIDVIRQSGIRMKDLDILVDINYRTNDPNIYALGKFINLDSEVNHQYKYVSPREAAEKLMQILNLYSADQRTYETKYSKPCYFQAQLPMEYFMIKVTMPKRFLANHLSREFRYSLTTYDGNFSRVTLNEYGVIEEILVISQNKMNYDFLQYFCGKHEKLLNNLHSRWYLKEITSFLDFFQEPWTELIMHDHFEELREQNYKIIREVAEGVFDINMERRERMAIMKRALMEKGSNKKLEDVFLKFLRKHRKDFQFAFALPEDFATKSS